MSALLDEGPDLSDYIAELLSDNASSLQRPASGEVGSVSASTHAASGNVAEAKSSAAAKNTRRESLPATKEVGFADENVDEATVDKAGAAGDRESAGPSRFSIRELRFLQRIKRGQLRRDLASNTPGSNTAGSVGGESEAGIASPLAGSSPQRSSRQQGLLACRVFRCGAFALAIPTHAVSTVTRHERSPEPEISCDPDALSEDFSKLIKTTDPDVEKNLQAEDVDKPSGEPRQMSDRQVAKLEALQVLLHSDDAESEEPVLDTVSHLPAINSAQFDASASSSGSLLNVSLNTLDGEPLVIAVEAELLDLDLNFSDLRVDGNNAARVDELGGGALASGIVAGVVSEGLGGLLFLFDPGQYRRAKLATKILNPG